MSKRNAISELNNLKTTEMYKRQFTSLAENVFNFKNLDNKGVPQRQLFDTGESKKIY